MSRAARDYSFHNDKAVQDNVVESWLCVDCGVNTAPGAPDGPSLRLDIALYGQSEVSFDRNTEVYTVKDKVWAAAGMRPWNGCLCIGCLERRIGRRLRPRDFQRNHPFNAPHIPGTPRLKSRLSGWAV